MEDDEDLNISQGDNISLESNRDLECLQREVAMDIKKEMPISQPELSMDQIPEQTEEGAAAEAIFQKFQQEKLLLELQNENDTESPEHNVLEKPAKLNSPKVISPLPQKKKISKSKNIIPPKQN